MNHSHREKVLEIVKRLKTDAPSEACGMPTHPSVTLQPVTWSDAGDSRSVELLAEWRKKANPFFPAQFSVTAEGTHRWLIKSTLEAPERLLFWAVSPTGEKVGHLGLFRFEFDDRSVELDNVVRGVEGVLPGLMQAAVESLMTWTFETLAMQAMYLRVLSDNHRALRLYQRCGFEETMRMPLLREEEGEVVRWVEATSDNRRPVKRYFVTMRLLAAEQTGEHKRLAGPHRAPRSITVSH
jgi:RimJ/RimL family protein N-acetyltransferase